MIARRFEDYDIVTHPGPSSVRARVHDGAQGP